MWGRREQRSSVVRGSSSSLKRAASGEERRSLTAGGGTGEEHGEEHAAMDAVELSLPPPSALPPQLPVENENESERGACGVRCAGTGRFVFFFR